MGKRGQDRAVAFAAAVVMVCVMMVCGACAGSKVRVGMVPDVEPFAFEDPTAGLVGFDVDLVSAVMTDAELQYEVVRFESIAGLIDEVAKGSNSSVDFAAAALTVTLDREQIMDFSQPYFDSGLSVMVPTSSASQRAVIDALFSPLFLLLIFIFVLGLLIFGHCMWVLERKTNSEFSKPYTQGVFDGVWWASVTATTVGYGDIHPHSRAGKLATIFVMFWGLVVTSFFVGSVSSSLTLSTLSTSINSVNDLNGRRVGLVGGQASTEYARSHIPAEFFIFESLEEAFAAMMRRQVEAIVDDAPLLTYYAAFKSFGRAKVVGDVFNAQRYAFAIPFDAPIAETINVALAKLELEGAVGTLYRQWFVIEHGTEAADETDQIHVDGSTVAGFGITMGVVLGITLFVCGGTWLYKRERDRRARERLPSADSFGTPLMPDDVATTPMDALCLAPHIDDSDIPASAASVNALRSELAEVKAMLSLLVQRPASPGRDSYSSSGER